MESEDRSGLVWLAVALLITLLCCLCLIVLVGAGALAVINYQSPGTSVPTVQASTARPVTPVSPPGDTSVVPEEAYQTEGDLRAARVPIADPIDLAERLAGVGKIDRVLETSAPARSVGETQQFWVSDVDQNTNFQIDAELAYATDHVYFWVEDGVNYRAADVKALVDEFENKIYPTDREFFGSEWTPGVDGDQHLYILFARGLGATIAGYFASNDSYPPAIHEYSNGHEMFYLSADNVDLRDEFTYGVLAHEFQHMIHWNLDRNEETWMNEGFSEVASLLNNYDVGGFDFAYAQNPDQPLTFWPPDPGTTTSHYGQSFLFLSYFLQRFGSEATMALVANPENGLDSVDASLAQLGERDETTGEVMTADDVFRDWAVAMLLQDPSVGDGRYGITEYDNAPRSRLSDDFGTNCPVSTQNRTVAPYGVDYIRFACDSPQTLTFDGSNVVQVVPADPHSGDYAFWSNRGDESDMNLSRSFDLSGVEGPVSIDYWVWYDIEEGWDYLYLEASDDGGETWNILETPSGTDEDPSGNSYGWGYTSTSGGGEQGRWISESVDLSDYAGGEVVLRFEYVTDAAVNGEGLLLDDVAIDAIGYQAGFEKGDDGWDAAGFVRIFNRLPQTYRLMLVERGSQTDVRELTLDDNQAAQVRVPFGDGVDEAFLVVVDTARHTWQPAAYTVGSQP
jgi:immune inhibitor A